MNATRSLLTLPGTLALLAVAALAQSGPPVSESPPSSPDQATTSVPRAAKGTELNLTDATHPTGRSTGNITVRELRFSGVDANADGRISLSEFVTFMDAGNVARSSETNGGGINPTEMLFRQIDRNGDNFLSESEVNAYQEEQDRNGPKR